MTTQFFTEADMAEALQERVHRVHRVVESRGIKPTHRVAAGRMKLYSRDALEQVRHELTRIDRERGVAFA